MASTRHLLGPTPQGGRQVTRKQPAWGLVVPPRTNVKLNMRFVQMFCGSTYIVVITVITQKRLYLGENTIQFYGRTPIHAYAIC